MLADRLVIVVGLGLQAVVHGAPAPAALGRDVDDDGQVRHETVDGPGLDLVHLVGAQIAARPR